MSDYITEHDAVFSAVQCYIEGARAGKSELMRPGFHPEATLVGQSGDHAAPRPIQHLFDWIDGNGPAARLDARVAAIDILDTIAVVRLEVAHWKGRLAGDNARMSDLFVLVRLATGWKITQKAFHWHS
jgi:hypothetical protein